MKHPLQPIYKDTGGVLRFQPNRIIQHLFDIGKIDLNELAFHDFSNEDRKQLAQLLGYSVYGYGTLSYVSGDDVIEALKNSPK